MLQNTTVDMPDSDAMAVAKKMHWVTSSIVALIFVVIGIGGNVLSLIIWSKTSMRSSTGTYLIFQAIADVSVLVFFVLYDSIGQINPDILGQKSYGEFYAYFGYPFFFLSVIVSIWMLVGVTVDRYIQVCWPHKSQEKITNSDQSHNSYKQYKRESWTNTDPWIYQMWDQVPRRGTSPVDRSHPLRALYLHQDFCSQHRVFLGGGIIFLLCFIINIPHFKTYEPLDTPMDGKAFSLTEYGQSEGSTNYEFWVHCMFLVLAPWLSIFTLNILILRRVFTSNRKSMLKKEKTRKAETQLTRLLLTVTFTFLVLIIFQCVTQCFFMLKPKDVDYRMVSEAFSIAKLGVVINSSVNFFLYCLSGRKFRKELWKALCCCRGAHVALNKISSVTSTSGTESTKL
ncbi:probable G-protein coupled receptor 139 isoform X1 [Ostrea edulis]|uniref:probable G-protein coupled receptor 139 isoform X1 n=1 Tax=Ostrea edulis TaxID=37623 RepID=UPI0020943801|nr:probable G-protein coupled receptor 139 isoform X1 [Ostrea edulis]